MIPENMRGSVTGGKGRFPFASALIVGSAFGKYDVVVIAAFPAAEQEISIGSWGVEADQGSAAGTAEWFGREALVLRVVSAFSRLCHRACPPVHEIRICPGVPWHQPA